MRSASQDLTWARRGREVDEAEARVRKILDRQHSRTHLGSKLDSDGCALTVLNAKRSHDRIRVSLQATHLQTLFHTERRIHLADGAQMVRSVLTRLPSRSPVHELVASDAQRTATPRGRSSSAGGCPSVDSNH